MDQWGKHLLVGVLSLEDEAADESERLACPVATRALLEGTAGRVEGSSNRAGHPRGAGGPLKVKDVGWKC